MTLGATSPGGEIMRDVVYRTAQIIPHRSPARTKIASLAPRSYGPRPSPELIKQAHDMLLRDTLRPMGRIVLRRKYASEISRIAQIISANSSYLPSGIVSAVKAAASTVSPASIFRGIKAPKMAPLPKPRIKPSKSLSPVGAPKMVTQPGQKLPEMKVPAIPGQPGTGLKL